MLKFAVEMQLLVLNIISGGLRLPSEGGGGWWDLGMVEWGVNKGWGLKM